jgi:hypothetical protein
LSSLPSSVRLSLIPIGRFRFSLACARSSFVSPGCLGSPETSQPGPVAGVVLLSRACGRVRLVPLRCSSRLSVRPACLPRCRASRKCLASCICLLPLLVFEAVGVEWGHSKGGGTTSICESFLMPAALFEKRAPVWINSVNNSTVYLIQCTEDTVEILTLFIQTSASIGPMCLGYSKLNWKSLQRSRNFAQLNIVSLSKRFSLTVTDFKYLNRIKLVCLCFCGNKCFIVLFN